MGGDIHQVSALAAQPATTNKTLEAILRECTRCLAEDPRIQALGAGVLQRYVAEESGIPCLPDDNVGEDLATFARSQIKHRARVPRHNEGPPGAEKPSRVGGALWLATKPSTFVIGLEEGQVVDAAVEGTKLRLTLEYQLAFDHATRPAQFPFGFATLNNLRSDGPAGVTADVTMAETASGSGSCALGH